MIELSLDMLARLFRFAGTLESLQALPAGGKVQLERVTISGVEVDRLLLLDASDNPVLRLEVATNQ